MPGPTDPIASARAKIYAVPGGGGTPVPLAIVENLRGGNRYASENLIGVGDIVPSSNVINNMQGNLSWGRVHKLDPAVLQTIAPTVQGFAGFESFDILAVDPVDNTPILRAVGVLPEVLDVDMTGGRALRQQYQGLCRYVQNGQEILAAAA